VRIERIAADQPRRTAPELGVLGHPPSLVPPPNILRYGARFGGGDQRSRELPEAREAAE
jgi:hypothetical protein